MAEKNEEPKNGRNEELIFRIDVNNFVNENL